MQPETVTTEEISMGAEGIIITAVIGGSGL